MLSLFKRVRSTGSRLGVLVTADGVAAAHVTRTGDAKPRLESCVYEAREPGTGQDAVARALSKFRARRITTVNVLDVGEYHLLLIEAPDVPADELRAAVRWRIKDLIDFHIDDAVIDVFEMPQHARGGPRKMMYAVTAKTEAIRQQIDLVETAGIKLDAIDIPELTLRNVVTRLEPADRGGALLYLAERRSTLLLVRQGVLYLARHVDTGATSLSEAGPLRRELVSGLALEARRSLDYFESHYEQTSIPRLHTSGLDREDREQLEQELGIPVRPVELASFLDCPAELTPELESRCLPAVGAALRRDAVAL
jgi:MSHA biogenesis protein MshI